MNYFSLTQLFKENNRQKDETVFTKLSDYKKCSHKRQQPNYMRRTYGINNHQLEEVERKQNKYRKYP